MAVARCELMVSEIDWVVATLKASDPPPSARRAMRELERQQKRAHESAERERRHTRRMRERFPTDAENACPACQAAAGHAHSPECPSREESRS